MRRESQGIYGIILIPPGGDGFLNQVKTVRAFHYLKKRIEQDIPLLKLLGLSKDLEVSLGGPP